MVCKLCSLIRSALLLGAVVLLSACGGGGPSSGGTPSINSASPPEVVAVVLRPPVLSFKDTGLSVSDGITGNGIWDVASDINWEFSLDQGATWTRGAGSSFEVTGDGAKVIWVRSWDDAGNTSEIVRVNCVLDTTAPGALGVSGQTEGVTNSLRLSGIEPGARWEYSLDEKRSWAPGQCSALAFWATT